MENVAMDGRRLVKLEAEAAFYHNQLATLLHNYSLEMVLDISASNLRLIQEEIEENERIRRTMGQ